MLALLAVLCIWPGQSWAAQSPPGRPAGRPAGADLVEQASRLELGLGQPADPTAAMILFCRSARTGNRAAIMHIAGWLLMDDGPAYNPMLAARWLRFAQTLARGIQPAGALANPRCPVGGTVTLTVDHQRIDQLVEALAGTRGVDPDLVKAVIVAESSYQSDAVSRAGAAGLMQLMPATALELGVMDRFDIEQNLRGGIDYLASLLARYNGNVPLALAAYNAGPAAVDRCACVPNNGETFAYVERVRDLHGGRR